MTRAHAGNRENAAERFVARDSVASSLRRVLGATGLIATILSQPVNGLSLDPTSFGTGVYFGTTQFIPPFTHGELDGVVIPNRRHSSDEAFFTAGSAGTAAADASPTEFSVGTDAISQHSGGIHSAFAGAVAYTGMTIDGDTPPMLPGAINIEGTITPEEEFDGGFMRIFVNDFNSPFNLADLLVQAVGGIATAGRPPAIQYTYEVCSSPTSCTAQSGLPWTGSFSLPFSVPLGSNNGIILSMFSQADAAFHGGGTLHVAFLDTASITFTPPDGTIVRLATGQVFAGDTPISPAPEPASVLLVVMGLALLARAQRRRVLTPQ
jgi:hypothetical protein